MKIDTRKLAKLAAMGGASLLLAQALHAATAITVPNGGFDNHTDWNGSYLSGNEGGNGWNASYFVGGYPTGNTFATTIGSSLSQNLSGANSTFVAGNTYTLTMQIFSATRYAGYNAPLSWSLGLTAYDGVNTGLVATDRWFSEEYDTFATIPDDHITIVDGTSPGLKTVILTYTATAADAGKVIGIRLADDWTPPGGEPAPARYYSYMDNVTLSFDVVPEPSTLALGAAGALGLLLRRRRP